MGKMPHIVFVDDEPNVLKSFKVVLREYARDWKMSFARSVGEALEVIRDNPPDAVITDFRMEGGDGFDLIRALRASERDGDVPVTIVTGVGESTLKRRALDLGATDLLDKPVLPEDLIARIRNMLRLKAYQDEIRAQNETLERKVKERTAALERSRLEIIWRLAKAGEYRDENTGEHVIRVGWCCRILAEKLGCSPEFCNRLFIAGPLHDIGKIGIPDHILRKPGPLNAAEWEVMRAHCRIGAGILREKHRMFDYLGAAGNLTGAEEISFHNPFLETAALIAETHHERWDGRGYPAGLEKERIPFEGRILAAVDVYDALTSLRPYKKPFSPDKSIRIMAEESGSRFDPVVFDAFLSVHGEFNEIRKRFPDTEPIAFSREST